MGLNRNKKEHMHVEHNKAHGNCGQWIGSAVKNKGALHRELNVPDNKKIPEKKLEKATHSKNPTLKRRAILAETLASFKHKK